MLNYGYTNNGLQLPPYSVAIISEGTIDAPTRVDYYGLELATPGANLANQLLTRADVLSVGGYLIASLHIANGGMQTRLIWAQR